MSVRNVSSDAKTVKGMFTLLENDNYSIDHILYYCKFKNSDDKTQSIVECGNILDNYRDYFDKYLITVDVAKKFYYQPAAFAENYYGTPDLDFLVLYFARMSTMFDFNKPKIKVIPRARLLEINRLFTEYQDDVKNSYNNPSEYASL